MNEGGHFTEGINFFVSSRPLLAPQEIHLHEIVGNTMQLQVDQHAPRAGARDVAVQGQSCFRLEARFRAPLLYAPSACAFYETPTNGTPAPRPPPPRDLFHRRRCWARQRRMLIANMAPAMSTPSATPTRKTGSAGRREDHGLSIRQQCVVEGSVCVVRCEKFMLDPHATDRSGALLLAAARRRRLAERKTAGLNFGRVLISKENRVCDRKTLPHETRARQEVRAQPHEPPPPR